MLIYLNPKYSNLISYFSVSKVMFEIEMKTFCNVMQNVFISSAWNTYSIALGVYICVRHTNAVVATFVCVHWISPNGYYGISLDKYRKYRLARNALAVHWISSAVATYVLTFNKAIKTRNVNVFFSYLWLTDGMIKLY